MGRCMRLDCQRGDISIRTAHRKNGSARELFCVHVAKRRKILPASNGLANFPLNTEFWANAKQREIFGANTTRCGPPAGELGGRPCHERHGAWSGGTAVALSHRSAGGASPMDCGNSGEGAFVPTVQTINFWSSSAVSWGTPTRMRRRQVCSRHTRSCASAGQAARGSLVDVGHFDTRPATHTLGERRFDERIEIAVEHIVRARALIARAQILYELIGLQNI